jgi:hypothetical protein
MYSTPAFAEAFCNFVSRDDKGDETPGLATRLLYH